MMTVLLDCRMASWSGVGRYTTGLARALAARADVKLVQVCAAGESPPAPRGTNVESVDATAHPFGPRGALELGRIVGETRPDVVHCAHFPTPAPVRRPLVVTLHDLTPLLIEGVMPSASRRFAYKRWNARAARVADVVLVPSRSTARDVAALLPAAAEKVTVIPEAADDFSSGPATPLTGALAELASRPYLLAMGSPKAHKDLPTLLRAFDQVARGRPDLRLLLVGPELPGYVEEQPPRLLKRDVSRRERDWRAQEPAADVLARVAFTGRVSDGELRTLYAGATIFVFPSRYEGFGLPVLEAMALGACVVCADATSLPEVTGDAALLFPAGDSRTLAETIARLLNDDDLRAKLVAAGRERAGQFSWDRTAEATMTAYGAALRLAGARRHPSGRGTQGGET